MKNLFFWLHFQLKLNYQLNQKIRNLEICSWYNLREILAAVLINSCVYLFIFFLLHRIYVYIFIHVNQKSRRKIQFPIQSSEQFVVKQKQMKCVFLEIFFYIWHWELSPTFLFIFFLFMFNWNGVIFSTDGVVCRTNFPFLVLIWTQT